MTDFNCRDFSTFVELADTPGGRGVLKSQVWCPCARPSPSSVSGYPSALSLLASFPCALSITLSSFPSHIRLSGCPSAPPVPSSPPTSVSAHFHLDLCVLLASVPYYSLFTFFHQFFCLTVLHISLVLYFLWSHCPSILDKNLPHLQPPVVRMNLDKLLNSLSLSFLICITKGLVCLENNIYM